MNDKLVLCIPGLWKDEDKLIRKLMRKSRGAYSLSGGLLLDTKQNRAFEIRIEEHDPKLIETFRYASRGDLSDKHLQKVEKHTKVIYLSAYMGSLDLVQRIIAPVGLLLASGGIAVKIENTGKAFTSEEWNVIEGEARLDQLLNAMISYMRDDNYVYSCGMQMFGYPDVAMSKDIDSDDALLVMAQFLYRIMSKGKEAQEDLGEFKLYGNTYLPQYQEAFFHEENPYMNNPYGVYVLTDMQ